MADAFEPLPDAELQELDRFLLYEVESDDSMVIDTFDDDLHAIAIGPTPLHPKQWLPNVWGMDTMLPPMKSAKGDRPTCIETAVHQVMYRALYCSLRLWQPGQKRGLSFTLQPPHSQL